MKCKKCGGAIEIDGFSGREDIVDMHCLVCDKRWALDTRTSVLAQRIKQQRFLRVNSIV